MSRPSGEELNKMMMGTSKPVGVKKRVTFVHNQYNSPLGLYSPFQVADTLSKHSRLLENDGADVEIDFDSLCCSTSPPLAASSPNSAQSCNKMLTQEQQNRRPWQLQQEESRSIMTSSSTSSEMKRVAWPPVAPTTSETNDNNEYLNNNYVDQPSASTKVAPRVPPKPALRHHRDQDIGINSDIDMPSGNSEAHREPFASTELVGERSLIAKPPPPTGLVLSGRPLKAKAPLNQEPRAVYSTESYFKRGTTPVRMLGDLVWPPKGTAGVTDKSQDSAPQSPGLVRRQQKDYRGFFNQHQLPPSFPTYRAPPGTQHFGLEEGENSTAM